LGGRAGPLFGFAQALGEALGDLHGQRGVLLEQRRALPGGDAVDAHRRLGDHRSGAPAALVEQRDLTEGCTGTERCEAGAMALDAGAAVGDHEDPATALALAEDGVAVVVRAFLGGPGDRGQLLVREPLEQRAPPHNLDPLISHGYLFRKRSCRCECLVSRTSAHLASGVSYSTSPGEVSELA